jgi:hypothetical protein
LIVVLIVVLEILVVEILLAVSFLLGGSVIFPEEKTITTFAERKQFFAHGSPFETADCSGMAHIRLLLWQRFGLLAVGIELEYGCAPQAQSLVFGSGYSQAFHHGGAVAGC